MPPGVANWEKTVWGKRPVVGEGCLARFVRIASLSLSFLSPAIGVLSKGNGARCWGGRHFHKGSLCCFRVDSGETEFIQLSAAQNNPHGRVLSFRVATLYPFVRIC